MERYSYFDKHEASEASHACSSPGTFFTGTRLMGNLSMSNRNSVLTDDSGVFEDVISKSDSSDSELFGDPNNPLLSFSSPAPRNRVSESEQAESPEQLEACMNPLYMLDSWRDNNSSPDEAKNSSKNDAPQKQDTLKTQSDGSTSSVEIKIDEKSTSNKNHPPNFMRPNSIDLLSFDSYASTYRSTGEDPNFTVRLKCEETTPTPAKKLVNQSTSLSNSPRKQFHFSPTSPGDSYKYDNHRRSSQHNRRRISSIECDSVEALNVDESSNSLSQLNIYLDDGCTSSDAQESTLTYCFDGFYEDNPFTLLQGCQLTSPTNSNASNNNNNIPAKAKHNSTRRKTKSSSDTSSQLRSQQPRVEPRYEKAHLYPKKYGKTDNMPEHQIYVELHQLEEMLKELQHKGTQIEHVLHCIAKESGAKTRCEESVLLGEWLELVRSKNRIVRRENELMHILNQRELEEIQEAITDKLRHLMTAQPKTEVETAEEERLLANLLQVVEKRNGIVQILEQDRLNEELEDQKCEDLLSPEKLRDATTRQKTWRSIMSNFRESKWAKNVKAYYSSSSRNSQY